MHFHAMEKGKSKLVMSENGGEAIKSSQDRRKVRILLCDTDVESCQEVFALLRKCSYQGTVTCFRPVTPVFSATEVVGVLNSEGPHTDIILAEAALLMTSGAKILKYIMQDEYLQHVPVIMMLTQDEVSLIFKGLGLGAADYLMKPIGANELLNLWTHIQKRRGIV
ncbi:hypothetical protein RJ639_000787 [Escallonia herrerae]|uniref:Response regulatory domain-containing protein n=1 Tax=Escallonia herrerae TaxID=1293975 RepID=A0AA88XAJ7_9ASTE|nr:hypothetical protein RJ639_000787 [Escallonia herrerae]